MPALQLLTKDGQTYGWVMDHVKWTWVADSGAGWFGGGGTVRLVGTLCEARTLADLVRLLGPDSGRKER